jgi:hypothetical protein
MKIGFFYKRNSKLCHTCINVIIISKESGYLVHTIIIEFIYERAVEMISDNSLGSTVVKNRTKQAGPKKFSC